MSTPINISIAETLTILDGYLVSFLGSAQITLVVADQADPGLQDLEANSFAQYNRQFAEALKLLDAYRLLLAGNAEIDILVADQADQGLLDATAGPASPARLTQAAVEVVVLPTDAKARLTQAPVEVIVQNTVLSKPITGTETLTMADAEFHILDPRAFLHDVQIRMTIQ